MAKIGVGNPFIVPVPDPEQQSRINLVDGIFQRFYQELEDVVPMSAEKTLGMRDLQTARARMVEAVMGVTLPRR